jgi:hypothetical protein
MNNEKNSALLQRIDLQMSGRDVVKCCKYIYGIKLGYSDSRELNLELYASRFNMELNIFKNT